MIIRLVLPDTRRSCAWARIALATNQPFFVLLTKAPPFVNIATPKNSFSERELEVVRCIADGMTHKQAGEFLRLSPLTIKSHIARSSRSLGVKGREMLVATCIRQGWIT